MNLNVKILGKWKLFVTFERSEATVSRANCLFFSVLLCWFHLVMLQVCWWINFFLILVTDIIQSQRECIPSACAATSCSSSCSSSSSSRLSLRSCFETDAGSLCVKTTLSRTSTMFLFFIQNFPKIGSLIHFCFLLSVPLQAVLQLKCSY